MTSLTPRERARMVSDLNALAEKYHNKACRDCAHINDAVFYAGLSQSFSALADAIKAERRFEAVA